MDKRYSTQVLEALGQQSKIVSNGSISNSIKYGTGTTVAPADSSVLSAKGVVSAISPNQYNSTVAFFTARGSSLAHAESMALLYLDTAQTLGVPVAQLLSTSKYLAMSEQAYGVMNYFRPSGSQVAKVQAVDNFSSPVKKEIRG